MGEPILMSPSNEWALVTWVRGFGSCQPLIEEVSFCMKLVMAFLHGLDLALDNNVDNVIRSYSREIHLNLM